MNYIKSKYMKYIKIYSNLFPLFTIFSYFNFRYSILDLYITDLYIAVFIGFVKISENHKSEKNNNNKIIIRNRYDEIKLLNKIK